MALENAEYVPELVATNPLGVDSVNLGDNHLRIIKLSLLNSFSGFVGTQVSPKSVTLTEDEINDAAQKAAQAIITGDWQLAHLIPLQGQDDVATPHDLVKCFHDGTRNVNMFGNNELRSRLDALDAVDSYINDVLTARVIAAASGGLLVSDMSANLKKAGFRNPDSFILAAGAVTLLQSYEGQIVENANASRAITVPVLEVDTTMTILSRNVAGTTLIESGTTINWADGTGTFKTGTRNIAGASVIQLQWRTATEAILWGNGIS